VRAWARAAIAARWGHPVPEVPLVMTPRAVEMRLRRALARRRAAYAGVKYHDRMASDPVVVAEVRATLRADLAALGLVPSPYQILPD